MLREITLRNLTMTMGMKGRERRRFDFLRAESPSRGLPRSQFSGCLLAIQNAAADLLTMVRLVALRVPPYTDTHA